MSRIPLPDRIAALDWAGLHLALDQRGFARTGALLTAEECASLGQGYDDDALYRSRVVMARHGFGQGEYRYFTYPLPQIIQDLREGFYPPLVHVANHWNARMNLPERYPPDLASMLARCHEAGQTRPTPLILKYEAGDHNCLHQDLYGDHVFPLQVAFLLSRPGHDFEGGEFVLVEQRPRMQSRPQVVSLRQGEGIVFAVHHRPVQGARGSYRVNLRHGVSELTSGRRFTAGVIFHDAA